jgi:hypothetical protein
MPSTHDDESTTSDDHDDFLDEIALRRAAAIFAEGGARNVGEDAGERGALVASIQYLAHQVPMWVLRRLGEETLEHKDSEQLMLDWVNQHEKSFCERNSNSGSIVGDNNSVGNVSEMSMDDQSAFSLNYFFQPEIRSREQENASILLPNVSRRGRSALFRTDEMHASEHLSRNLEEIHELTNEVDTNFGRPKSSQLSVRQGWMASFECSDTDNKQILPHVSSHQCAMLFVDISGFTKLSTLLDAEPLSKVRTDIWTKIICSHRPN